MEIIKHFTHQHELSLSREKKRKYPVACGVCNEYCDEGVMIYSCRESDCRFTLHESCAKLPQELHNPLLHPHPLSLKRPEYMFFDFKCNGCGNISRGFSFHCDKCDVNLDVKCGFIRPAMEEGEEAVVVGTHFSHRQHPLVPLENIPASHISCSVCGKYCSDPMTYGCLPCSFFLHPSCFKLPEEIFHPFHPYHPLTLKPPIKGEGRRHCHACRRYIQDDYRKFAYVCECKINCSFCLDLECASVKMPAITYEGHDHLLQFDDRKMIDSVYPKNCSACKSAIRESYEFRCLYCDFILHHTCGPLPSTIQHECHIDPLLFTNSPAEDEDETDDEFYCDACEEERDPFLPIYYCKECRFVAEISCVIPEIVSLLKGEHGDVELRNPFGQIGKLIREKQEQLMIKPALTTLFDIFNYSSLSEAEKNELNIGLLWDGRRETITSREITFKGDEAYTQFMKFVDIGTMIPAEFRDREEAVQISDFFFRYWLPLKEEVVNIGDYMVTRKLAPILNDLFSKYGDVSAQSTLSPKAKLYFVHMLCECIYSMKNTKVVDITKIDLLNWWASLETSKRVGFRIQFAFDHLKRVALAHFGLYAEKQGSKALDQLNIDIEMLYENIKALKEKRQVITSIKSRIIEKCWRETSVLKGGKAGVGIP